MLAYKIAFETVTVTNHFSHKKIKLHIVEKLSRIATENNYSFEIGKCIVSWTISTFRK